ncbi:hypothetical protein BDN67DRAFT_1017177 [Paxillus ammoniavirescens]|nr:hypothetical protein BDN67DRAFT_1017177 [Paxillus ammoniavirescens]
MAGVKDAQVAFRALDDGIPDDQRDGWLKQEKVVMRERGIDPKVMDVFDVRIAKGEIAGFLADTPSYLGPDYDTNSDEGND